MSNAWILLCLFCAGSFDWCPGIDGSIIKRKKDHYEDIIEIARKEIGVRESGCQNCGPRVESYLAYLGIRKGSPWCAAFLSYCFGKAGYPQPRTAWSPALFPPSRKAVAGKGRVFGIWFPELHRIAHCGLVESVRGDWLNTIEGNTSPDGSREGTGVFRRLRHRRTIHCYSDWIQSNDRIDKNKNKNHLNIEVWEF